MQTRTPSNPAACGLCAAFFLAASVRWVLYLFHSATHWQQPGFFESFWWASVAVILVFVFASTFVGLRLLYLRSQSVSHGLILGWLCLLFSATTSVQFIYSLARSHTLQRPEQWVALLSGSTVSVLCPAIVVWLLHRVHSSERGGADSLPANLQIA